MIPAMVPPSLFTLTVLTRKHTGTGVVVVSVVVVIAVVVVVVEVTDGVTPK
jgi:hypothetical protein